MLAVVVLLLVTSAMPVYGQQVESNESVDLGQLYHRARTRAMSHRQAQKPVVPLPPVSVRTPRLDSLHAFVQPEIAAQKEEQVPLPTIRERHAVRRLGHAVFERRFSDVRWAYLGANGRSVLDTMQTRELRARLQAHYGDPTRTVVDAESLTGRPAADYIQFEYWFTANDSIPIKVVDTGGPFDRGLVFAAPVRYSGQLKALRAAFFASLLASSLRAPYVDYYYDLETDTWYQTGYDGRRFFTEPVPRSGVVPGRRPVLQRKR